MHLSAVFHVISWLIAVVALLSGASAAVSLPYGETAAALALGLSALAGLLAAGVLWLATRNHRALAWREGVGVVALGWLSCAAFAACPFAFARAGIPYVDGFFESVSGLTTTGATVFPSVEDLPHGLLFFRALLQGLGGAGVLMLVVAILPLAGAGSTQLYRAETSGGIQDRIAPRLATTAKWIWALYLGLGSVVTLLLILCGMDLFDAVCHAFSTISSGGFSTRNASIAAFGSLPVELVVTAGMVLSGIPFVCLLRVLQGDWRAPWKSGQVRLYLALFLCGGFFFAFAGCGTCFREGLRGGLFTSASVLSSCGFATADFASWSVPSQLVVMFLALVGGTTGSTSGGLKVERLRMGWFAVRRACGEFLQPRAVLPIRADGRVVEEEAVRGAVVFAMLYAMLAGAGALVLSRWLSGGEALSAAVSALSNTGPALGRLGPFGSYAAVPVPGKLLLALLMLAGRLELYTLLAVFTPALWRR
ncbi:MAG: TrkH family potassium uptake protein [Kiritimatiellae bacterium]|nr:TrkH family potassium uptake protein [Kiritimatiellia bacterium]